MPARAREFEHLLREVVEIHGHRAQDGLDAAEALDASHHLSAVLRGALDDLEVPLRVRLGHLGEQRLEPAEDDGEEVVEVMGHPRGELADRRERLAPHELGLRRLEVIHDALELARRLLRLLEQAGVVHGIADVGHQRVEELEVRHLPSSRG